MSILLNRRPSTSGLGVKRWTYNLSPTLVLHIFERPPQYARIPYLLRLTRLTGEHVETRFAKFKSQAIDKAQWIALRADQGEFDRCSAT